MQLAPLLLSAALTVLLLQVKSTVAPSSSRVSHVTIPLLNSHAKTTRLPVSSSGTARHPHHPQNSGGGKGSRNKILPANNHPAKGASAKALAKVKSGGSKKNASIVKSPGKQASGNNKIIAKDRNNTTGHGNSTLGEASAHPHNIPIPVINMPAVANALDAVIAPIRAIIAATTGLGSQQSSSSSGSNSKSSTSQRRSKIIKCCGKNSCLPNKKRPNKRKTTAGSGGKSTQPAADEMPEDGSSDAPAGEDTPAPDDGGGDTPAPDAAVEDTPAPDAGGEETPASEAGGEETPAPDGETTPAAEEGVSSDPAAEETSAPEEPAAETNAEEAPTDPPAKK